MHFIQTEIDNVIAARKLYPAAYMVVKVAGGFMAFDTSADYRIWCNQK